ncbi:MAG: ATP-binding protein [Bacteroidales bacterium]|jgi:anti-sigma regulatory factor (Ser/Thr protein kinase)|nr:ATP-binding protein [Bacteroidales bacterium]MCI2121398.1 ATP-binding protein [Bacteroidales bacterium]MCI2145483.1 ATP-binding protein [Bacteroidales bacterium]
MTLQFNVEGGDFARAGYASSQIKKILKEIGVDPDVIKHVVVALYEAEVNIVAHAYHGVITADIEKEGIRIVLDDAGPGIPDIPRAMERGYSTASPEVREMGFGAGMGLPNMKDNTDSLDIESVVGKGTKVTMYNKFE